MNTFDRRTFLRYCSASGVSLLHNPQLARAFSSSQEEYQPPPIFPELPTPKSLVAAPLGDNMTWHERTFFTCFQGLVNRREPRIYLIDSSHDRDWLEYYKTKFGIQYEIIGNPYKLIQRFAHELSGYVVYDEEMLDSANVATVLGSLKNAVPVSQQLAVRLKQSGLEEIDNLRGRWGDRLDAYEWAAATLFPDCNERLIALLCVDVPHWPSNSFCLRDYLMAHKIFTFDLSSSLRDRKDFDLLHRICSKVLSPGGILGWHCARDNEHEFVAVASSYGLFVICSTSTTNLSVHTAIPRPDKPFVQAHRKPADVKLENKVYISFMMTDGDSTSSMLAYVTGSFSDKLRGTFPYTWGILPSAYDFMPGVAQFYYENLTENDYLVAAPTGAAYTYPHFHPDARDFLRLSRYYMDEMGLRVVHMTNWDDEHWWQEVELPRFVPLLRQELPDCIGYVRGMGESAFERHYIGGGPPYIFCGEGIHRDSDVYSTITDFVNANTNRPLFIFSLVNFSVSMKRMKDAIDKFPKDEYELVRLDELLLLIDKAFAQGLVPEDDLYPEKAEIRKLIAMEARQAWTGTCESILSHSARAKLKPEDVVAQLRDTAFKRSDTDPADLLAFDAVWDSMKLVKLALNMRGVYVNNKGKAVADFMEAFGDLKDARVVEELWSAWLQWRKRRVSYDSACDLAHRLGLLTTALDRKLRAE